MAGLSLLPTTSNISILVLCDVRPSFLSKHLSDGLLRIKCSFSINKMILSLDPPGNLLQSQAFCYYQGWRKKFPICTAARYCSHISPLFFDVETYTLSCHHKVFLLLMTKIILATTTDQAIIKFYGDRNEHALRI